ncbi:MAG: exodeoxyribonuclease VII small subunit [Actinomycetota bacterium]|nr:exodeoxyribonuclease VII small subunit [Actinomycetota bacterium]
MSQDISFEEALSKLEAIVAQVKQPDIPLDKSLDLLEEGVRLANVCTEKTDHTYWREEIEESSDSESKLS